MSDEASAARRSWGIGDAATLVGLIVYALLPLRQPLLLGVVGAALLLLCLRPLPGDREFGRGGRAIVGGLACFAALAGPWYVWPAYLLVPLVLAIMLGLGTGFARDFRGSFVAGRLGRTEWGAIAVIAAVAGAALVAWVVLLEPDLDRQRAMLPAWPVFGLLAAGIAFSLLNAVLEEFIWRGLLLRWLSTSMPPLAAILAQAVSFGAAHYLGFPSGFVGAGLATIYGIMLGALAVRAGGLLAPIIAHVAADAIIFGLLMAS